MSDQWTDRLSPYLDGELSQEERGDLERHLETCDECKTALEQLQRVVNWAGSYAGRAPSRDPWPHIASAIGRARPGVVSLANRRVRGRFFRMPQALAAGIALLLVGTGSWWIARATAPENQMATVIDVSSSEAGVRVAAAIHAAQKYGPAIAELERALSDQQDSLDAATVKVLREQLAIIDRALAEAQEALARDPSSDFLVDHYTGMMKKKLTVLRAATRRPLVQG